MRPREEGQFPHTRILARLEHLARFGGNVFRENRVPLSTPFVIDFRAQRSSGVGYLGAEGWKARTHQGWPQSERFGDTGETSKGPRARGDLPEGVLDFRPVRCGRRLKTGGRLHGEREWAQRRVAATRDVDGK